MDELLLSGGAITGVVNHIAFLRAYDTMSYYGSVQINGTSAGALVGALYCKYGRGKTDEIIKDLKYVFNYKTVVTSVSIHGNPFKTNIAFLRNDKIRARLHKVLPESFDELLYPFLCYATDIPTGQAVRFDRSDSHGVTLPDAVLASMSFPGAFYPLSINGFELSDGGILMNVPFAEMTARLLRASPHDNYYVVDVSPNWEGHKYEYSILALFDIVRNKLEDDMYVEIMNLHDNAHLVAGNLVDIPDIPGPSIVFPWVYNRYMNQLAEAATCSDSVLLYKGQLYEKS